MWKPSEATAVQAWKLDLCKLISQNNIIKDIMVMVTFMELSSNEILFNYFYFLLGILLVYI